MVPVTEPIPRIPRAAQAFIAVTIGAGALIVAASIYSSMQHATAGWLVFAALGVVTGYLTMKVPGIQTRFSLSDALIFTSILLLGPERAAIVAGLDALAASLRFNRGEHEYISRTMFNVAVAALSVWLPGHLFLALLGSHSLGPHRAAEYWSMVLPVTTLIVSYSLLNTGAITLVLALTRQAKITVVWRENFAWVWVAHAWSGLVATAIAMYAPRVSALSLLVILVVACLGYATVRTYLRKAEESTGHLEKLNELYLATIRALAMAIDAKDQVTHGHIRRVQVYAVGMARGLGVTDELELKGIEAGALLHDTGKIAIPEYILNKPGKLNAHEYERMKTHAAVGADILSGIHFPYPVIPVVRHHHENWDGTGYPDRIKGEEIPLGARILSVVDCFDALTSDRPYRRALSADAAIAILRERSGTMYDPRVVERFIEICPQLSASLGEDESQATCSPALEVTASSTSDGANESAEELRDGLPWLEDVPRLAASGLLPEEVAFVLTNRLKGRLRFATCAVYLPRAHDDALEPVLVSGRHADLFRRSAIRIAEGLSGWVVAHGQMVINANPALDLQGPMASSEVQLKSALVVPFAAGHASRGALALYAILPNAFTFEQGRIAAAAAAHLSCALAGAAAAADQAQARYCA